MTTTHNTPTLTVRALGVALFEFNMAVAAFRDGKCQSVKVDEAYGKISRIVERVRDIDREARRIAEAAFRESSKTPGYRRMESAIGVPRMPGVRPLGLSHNNPPLVSVGPSGVGGYAQNEYLDESGFSSGAGAGGAK